MIEHIYRIEPDSGIQDPRTYLDNMHVLCSHKKYRFGTEEFDYREDLDARVESLMGEFPGSIKIPLYAYIHSGVVLSTNPFSCKWDSGQVGWIVVKPDSNGFISEDSAKLSAEAYAHEMTAYTNGEGYAYSLYRLLPGGDVELLESVGGFYDEEACEDDAKEQKAHFEREIADPESLERILNSQISCKVTNFKIDLESVAVKLEALGKKGKPSGDCVKALADWVLS